MLIFAAYDLDLQYLSLSLLRTTISYFRKTGSTARISVISYKLADLILSYVEKNLPFCNKGEGKIQYKPRDS